MTPWKQFSDMSGFLLFMQCISVTDRWTDRWTLWTNNMLCNSAV